MTDQPTLHGFTRVDRDHEYAILHQLLWPRGPTSSQPANSEPERLAQYIEACKPDLSLWTDDQGGDATAVDVDNLEQPAIRYIDLAKHRSLAVHTLRDLDKVIVRQEYVDFMADAITKQEKFSRIRFFLTGQPGIGKSIGACYLLFRLLASGRSVFFIPNVRDIFYFSEAGVEVLDMTQGRNLETTDGRIALERSWIIIDNISEEWFPHTWALSASCLVWTSSPRERRMHHFIKQFKATAWYMKPWSFKEIVVAMTLKNRDPNDVRARFTMSGPVAQSLFSDEPMVSAATIDEVINKALADNLFYFASSNVGDRAEGSHRMFLVRPQEVFDQAEQRPSLERELRTFDFLTNYVASRTAELMERHEHVEKVRRQLAGAFDSPSTRSAAGKLVESMLHRALIHRKIAVPAVLGGGTVHGELELIGQAEDFFLETHVKDQRDCPPLYLRPQSSDFGGVDAILVTATVVCLIQSSRATLHLHVVKTVLQILGRLETDKIAVDSLRLVYCIVGIDEDRVKRLVREASENLMALKARELGNISQIDRTRLSKLEVEGFTVDTQNGLVPLS